MAAGGSDATRPVMPFYTLNLKAEEKILSLESKWQVHFDWLKDVVEEAKIKFAKPGEGRELSLLPQTPGPKRGRRKRESQASQEGEEPSSKRIDLDATATTGRGGRAAAKAAQQRIANDVEEMANLNKKKRRPTALDQEEETSVKDGNDTATSNKNGSRVEFMDETVEATAEVVNMSSDLVKTVDPDPMQVENEELIIIPPEDNDENIETVPLSEETNEEELVISSPQQVGEASRNSIDETFESATNEVNTTYDAPVHAEVANATFNMDNTEETNDFENEAATTNEDVSGTFVLELEGSSADEAAANETFDVRKSDKEAISVDEDEALADNEADMEDENEEKRRKSKSLRKTSSMGPPRTSRSRQTIPDSEDEKTPVKKSRRTKSSIGEIENPIPVINREVTNVSEKSVLPVPSPRRINATKDGNSASSHDDSNTSSRSTRTKQKQNTSVSSDLEEKPSRSTRTKQKQNNSVSSETVSQEDDVARPSRSTRTKQKQNTSVAAETASVEEERPPSRSTRTRQKETSSVSSDTQEERPPSRSTRTKQKAPSSVSSQEEETSSRSSKTQLKETSSISSEESEKPASRSTRTKQKAVDVEHEEKPSRSTRTKQKQLQTEDLPESKKVTDSQEVKRSTRTKQKLLSHQSQSGSGSDVAGVASPRVRELVARAMSPSKNKTPSPRLVGYTGSPVMERVQVFEKAMRDSAGLKNNKESEEESSEKKTRGTRQSKSNQRNSTRTSRRSSIASSLLKVSAARRQSVVEVLESQEVSLVTLNATDSPARRGPIIRKSAGTTREVVNSSRAPAGKVVKPMRGVSKGVTPVIRGMTPGSRGVTPGSVGSSRVTPGSAGSQQGGRVRSRLGIMEKANKGTPGNMVARGGVTSFLPSKPKGPTLEEIQEQKEEERRKKEEKAADAVKKKEELMKKKMDEQREKREERIRRVQEARQAKENEQEMKRNRAKETEEKLAALAKREKKFKEEAEKKRINEARMKEAEERKAKEEEARLAKVAHQEELKNREAAEQERRMREEEDKKRRVEQARRDEEEKRKEKEKKKEEERRLQNEMKKREAERIAREKEELKKIKNREAEKEKEKNELNSTYTKPADATLNQTKEAGPSSYDMTPSRHGGDLPPQPLENAENYSIDDLDSEGSTDNEDAPRKEVPKWAEGALLRTALLKQCYMCPDLDALFETIDMPDLSEMFAHQRKRFYKRTSSAQWDTPPSSFKLGNRW